MKNPGFTKAAGKAMENCDKRQWSGIILKYYWLMLFNY